MVVLMALIPAICWGSIGLISGKLGGTSYQQTLGMTVGALLFGIFSVVYFHPQLTSLVWMVGIASGLFLVSGSIPTISINEGSWYFSHSASFNGLAAYLQYVGRCLFVSRVDH
ncbi:GRP family sugar transporter [Secundilactobacillus odoratitofui]|uniref:GRP family sugar transporter n=1 Tax=Secundilactobacillus odoratitofui TaxID=480930 RepID=UPI000A7C0EB5